MFAPKGANSDCQKTFWEVRRAVAPPELYSESSDMCGGFGSLAQQGFLARFPGRAAGAGGKRQSCGLLREAQSDPQACANTRAARGQRAERRYLRAGKTCFGGKGRRRRTFSTRWGCFQETAPLPACVPPSPAILNTDAPHFHAGRQESWSDYSALGPAATTSGLMWVYFLKFSTKLFASSLALAS